MAWFRVRLTEEEQRVVNEERCCHPNLRIREKMLVLLLLHNGLTREHAAKAVGVSRATVQRYVAAFRQGGLDRAYAPPFQGLRATFSCVFEGFSRELSSHYIINTNCNALYSPIHYRKVANM